MMKKIIIIIAILALLLFSGCATLSKIKLPGMPGTVTEGRKDFIGGIKGIEAEIINPREGGKVYATQQQRFQVAVEISNEGESKAEGTTCISGLNEKFFPGFSGCDCQDFMLEGKRKDGEQEEEKEILTFEGGKIQTEGLTEDPIPVTARTIYEYKTFGIIKACVKKDDYSEDCKITPETNIRKSVSSAPVSIEKVTQNIIPVTDETIELRFNIEIKNIGKGDVYSLEEDKTQCRTLDLKRKINVKMANAPGQAICDPVEMRTTSKAGIIGTEKDEAIAHCTVKNVRLPRRSYESEITVILEYAYETIDSNQFEVVS